MKSLHNPKHLLMVDLPTKRDVHYHQMLAFFFAWRNNQQQLRLSSRKITMILHWRGFLRPSFERVNSQSLCCWSNLDMQVSVWGHHLKKMCDLRFKLGAAIIRSSSCLFYINACLLVAGYWIGMPHLFWWVPSGKVTWLWTITCFHGKTTINCHFQ